MTSRLEPRAVDGADVPTTLLLGRPWLASGHSVQRLAGRLARRLGHEVDVCDLDGPPEELQALLRGIVARGGTRLVLLPVTLDEHAPGARRADTISAALGQWPFLRVHHGAPPATDDVARMLGDRAREATRSLGARRRPLSDVVVVIATRDRVSPSANADVARLARLVYEAHAFGDVAYAFVGTTTPSVGDAVARSARLGARAIVVVPHLLFDPGTHRRLAREARAAAATAGVDVAIARSLDGHPGLVSALVRRYLETLSEVTAAGGRAPWVNPELLRALDDGHVHGPGMNGEWEARMAALLPPRYREPGRAVSSAPMGAAPLERDADGRVAWDRMWQGFCELGLAGGPPHRGTLLEAISPDEALASRERYDQVRGELERGLGMVTGLPVVLDGAPGWIGLACDDDEMAIWLMRAIVVENVMARREGRVLFLPAGPRFRVEAEIKNVVTAVAKTYHYWTEHRASRRDASPSPLPPSVPTRSAPRRTRTRTRSGTSRAPRRP